MTIRKVIVRGRAKSPVFEVLRRYANHVFNNEVFDTYAEARKFITESVDKYPGHRFEVREVFRMEVFYTDKVTRLSSVKARKIDEIYKRSWTMEKKEVKTRIGRMN